MHIEETLFVDALLGLKTENGENNEENVNDISNGNLLEFVQIIVNKKKFKMSTEKVPNQESHARVNSTETRPRNVKQSSKVILAMIRKQVI